MTTAILSPKQLASIRDATAPANIWHGSVRSGKTLSSLIAFGDAVQRQTGRHGRVVIIGRTMDTIYRNVISGLIEALGLEAVRYTRGANTAVIFGQEVDIIGASDARSEGRIRGMTVRIAYVDEASLLPGEEFWQALMDRQMTIPDSRTFATTNPDNPMHWLKVSVIDRAGELGYPVWHFTLDDNPVLTEQDRAEAAARNTGLLYKRNIEGLWVLADGVIWDTWDEDRHVVDGEVDLTAPLQVGIDDGTAGTFAAQLAGRSTDGRLVVIRELRWNAKERQRQLSDAQKSQMLAEWLKGCEAGTWTHDGQALPAVPGAANPAAIHVDPSATSLIRQLELDGWRGVVAKARNDVRDGLQYVASLMALDRLRVHESCAGLRREIPGYVWDTKAAARGEDKPMKVNDHHCDALRYLVMGCADWWWHWLEQPRTEAPAEAA